MIRAYRTAEIITDELNLPKPEIMQDLIERDFGVMTGKHKEDIVKLCSPNIIKTDTITHFLDPEGAETFPELIERGHKAINKIKEKHKDGSILLVTHGDVGKMIYAAYYNLDWKHVLNSFHFGNVEVLLMSEESSADEAHIFKQKQYNN